VETGRDGGLSGTSAAVEFAMDRSREERSTVAAKLILERAFMVLTRKK